MSPRPDTPPQMPMASPRCCGGNACVMMASVPGIMVAAPTPCKTRKTTSVATLWAIPQAMDARIKVTKPAR